MGCYDDGSVDGDPVEVDDVVIEGLLVDRTDGTEVEKTDENNGYKEGR